MPVGTVYSVTLSRHRQRLCAQVLHLYKCILCQQPACGTAGLDGVLPSLLKLVQHIQSQQQNASDWTDMQQHRRQMAGGSLLARFACPLCVHAMHVELKPPMS